jgi:glutamate 5-kinase
VTPRHRVPAGEPIVVKVGSSSLASQSGGLNGAALSSVVDQVSELWSIGHPTVLVSSGAVAAGLLELGIERRPTQVPDLQAAAAVGQGRLMERYASEFGARQRLVGQVLLTKDVLANRSQYLHAREALDRMLALGIVPVVNEWQPSFLIWCGLPCWCYSPIPPVSTRMTRVSKRMLNC